MLELILAGLVTMAVVTIVTLVVAGVSLLVVIPVLLVVGIVLALVFGLGVLGVLLPMSPFILAAFLLWRLMRGGARARSSA